MKHERIYHPPPTSLAVVETGDILIESNIIYYWIAGAWTPVAPLTGNVTGNLKGNITGTVTIAGVTYRFQISIGG